MAANRNTQLGMHGISNQPQHHGPVRQLAATWGMQPGTAKLDTISIKLPQGHQQCRAVSMQSLQLVHIPKRKPHPQVPARKPIESSTSNLCGMPHPYNRPLSHPTGQLGEMPSPSNLPQSLRLLPASQTSNTGESIHSANLTQLLSNLTETYGASSKIASHSLTSVCSWA